MRTSKNGVAMIKRFEGFSSAPYRDVAGFNTIGYGHCIRQGEIFERISEPQAEALLAADLKTAEDCLCRLVKVRLSQNQFDALASFIYNVGAKAFENSTLLKLLNRGEHRLAATEFERWVYAGGKRHPGLISRRKSEKDMFYQDVIDI